MSEISKENEHVIEAALFAVNEPISVKRMQALYAKEDRPSVEEIRASIAKLQDFYQGRGVELVEVASGYTFRICADYVDSLQRYWDKRPPRYTKALLETLAIIAYRQPITRGQIEDVRGVAVSTNIMKTLQDREWVKIVGYREVPGKPALYATTKDFLDYFQLKKLNELPALEELLDQQAFDNPDEHMQQLLELDPHGQERQLTDGMAAKLDDCVQDIALEDHLNDNNEEHSQVRSDSKISSDIGIMADTDKIAVAEDHDLTHQSDIVVRVEDEIDKEGSNTVGSSQNNEEVCLVED